MAPESLVVRKGKKRKRIISLENAMKFTSSIIKKFRKMKIFDPDESSLPLKKRKLSENILHENILFSNTLNIHSVRDLSSRFENIKRKANSEDVCMEEIEIPKMYIRISTKTQLRSRLNFFNNSLKVNKYNQKNAWLSTEQQPAWQPQQLYHMFQNCVNFIQPNGYITYEDIDLVVRRFSTFGKVLSIQDHWMQRRGTLNSTWIGASVTYKNKDGFDCALKAFFEIFPLISISVVDHLAKINSVESEWMSKFPDSVNCGTSIIVECSNNRLYRYKIKDEFAKYGTVLKFAYDSEIQLVKTCEVTYKSTVSAVAAALALDGKTVSKCRIRTKIKIAAKELFIHRKLCELF